MAWTKEDEATLQALLERKQAEERVLRECVERAVAQWCSYGMREDDVVAALIEHATVMRKVLEPFDREAAQ